MSYVIFHEGARARRRSEAERFIEGSSVVFVSKTKHGVFVCTKTKGKRKITEVYRNIVLAGVGKPRDFELLRKITISVALMHEYNYSAEDVNADILARKLSEHMYAAFETGATFYRSSVALVSETRIYEIQYDGTIQEHGKKFILGSEKHVKNLEFLLREETSCIASAVRLSEKIFAEQEKYRERQAQQEEEKVEVAFVGKGKALHFFFENCEQAEKQLEKLLGE